MAAKLDTKSRRLAALCRMAGYDVTPEVAAGWTESQQQRAAGYARQVVLELGPAREPEFLRGRKTHDA